MNTLFLFIILIIVLLFSYKSFGISNKLLALIISILLLLYFGYYQYTEKTQTNNFEEQKKLNTCFVNPIVDNNDKSKIIEQFKSINKM